MSTDFLIRVMTDDDIPSVMALFDDALGEGYINPAELSEFGSKHGHTAFVATDLRGIVLGVATGLIDPNVGGALYGVPDDQVDAVLTLAPRVEANPVGVLKSVAVDRTARGRGVGHAVSLAVTSALRYTVPHIISIGWATESGCHIGPTLTRMGYTDHGQIENFWWEDSVKQGYSCPTCGHPCRCAARIFSLAT